MVHPGGSWPGMVHRLGRDDRGPEESEGPPRGGRTGAVPQGGSSVVLRLEELSGQPAPRHPSPLSSVGPGVIQEVNVQSPVAVTLSDFSFSFLEHCHPTHSSPLPPCHPPLPWPFLPEFSVSSPTPLPSRTPCSHGSTRCPLGELCRG